MVDLTISPAKEEPVDKTVIIHSSVSMILLLYSNFYISNQTISNIFIGEGDY